MAAVEPDARVVEALNRVLRGNAQKAADLWAAIQPQLQPTTKRLAAAIRGGDGELIAFEYRRAEVLNRRVGELLLLIDATLAEIEPLADEPSLGPVQARVEARIRSLAAMRRVLGGHLKVANHQEAKAVAAIRAAKRRDESIDADWERLRARLAALTNKLDGLAAEMQWYDKRSDTGAARTSPERMAELQKGSARLVEQAPVAALEQLRRDFLRVVDATVVEAASRDFAAQFSHERPAFEQKLEQAFRQVAALRAGAARIGQMRVQLDTVLIARLLGVPLAAVRAHERPLAAGGSEQVKALAAIAQRNELDRSPKQLLDELRRKGLVG